MKLLAWKWLVKIAAICLGFAMICPAMPQNATQTLTLRAGTAISLVFLENLSSADAGAGATVWLVLGNNVTVSDAIVVKSGTKAYAKVAAVVRAKPPGRSGQLTLHLEPLHIGTQTIPLCANLKNGGDEVHYERPYHLKWPMGLLRTGDDVEIPSGTSLTVFVAQDVRVSVFD